MSHRQYRQRPKLYKPQRCPGGLIRADGVVICKVTKRGTIVVKDKDRRRAQVRGTPMVEIKIEDLQELCTEETKEREGVEESE